MNNFFADHSNDQNRGFGGRFFFESVDMPTPSSSTNGVTPSSTTSNIDAPIPTMPTTTTSNASATPTLPAPSAPSTTPTTSTASTTSNAIPSLDLKGMGDAISSSISSGSASTPSTTSSTTSNASTTPAAGGSNVKQESFFASANRGIGSFFG